MRQLTWSEMHVVAMVPPAADCEETVTVGYDAAVNGVIVVRTRPVGLLAGDHNAVPLPGADAVLEADAVTVGVEVAGAGAANEGGREAGQQEKRRDCKELHIRLN